ncbi:MAG: biosynthetic peptidoglycan transglycosylase [Comamonadaceae bacterium]|nr:biosynthetic peptidoglycan transglycosylase [Comamonadaceae bacterium]
MPARPIPTVRPWHRWWRLAAWLALALGLTLAALWTLLRALLAPADAQDWTVTLGRGPLALPASVPQLAWLATTPWIGERLHGLRLRTRLGPVTFGWIAAGEEGPQPVLTLHCEPCTLPLPAQALGLDAHTRHLALPAAQLALSRDRVQHLRGTLLLGAHALPTSAWHGPAADAGPPVLIAHWQAERSGPGWQLQLHWPAAPVRHWLALLAPQLPELAVARIDGHLALQAELPLPARPGAAGAWRVAPQLHGLAVSGLGTQRWPDAAQACAADDPLPAAPTASTALTPPFLSPHGWLARAVLAAEDQRFYQHPGYDLAEITAALSANRQRGAIWRGGSTLSQQLAKLMVTGGERTLARKLRELLYAVEAEQTLGKARILQLYLALAPWGEDAQGRPLCGAEAAARHYFGARAAALTPRQAVTLAAMLHNPRRAAATWAAQGSVNRARLNRIARDVRGVLARQRRALARALAQEHAALAGAHS